MTTVRIYDRAFTETGVCGGFVSLKYRLCFRGAGEAELVLPMDNPAAGLLISDGYIKVPGGEYFRICLVERDLRKCTVRAKCRGLLSFFEGAVIPEEYCFDGDVGSIMYSLARKSRDNFPVTLDFESTGMGRTVKVSSGRSVVYDDLVSLCYMGDVGMRMDYNGGVLFFSVLSPRDRRTGSTDAVLASSKMGTFEAERLEWDLSSYKNVAVVSGTEKESGGRYTTVVRSDSLSLGDFPDGDFYDRQTLVRFASPVRQYMYENAEGLLELNEGEYINAMKAAGAALLGRCRPKVRLTGLSANEDLLPGDVVTLTESYTGTTGAAVTEAVSYEYSDRGFFVTAELEALAEPSYNKL